MTPEMEERLPFFAAKVDVLDGRGCWFWTAALKDGYGNFWSGQRTMPAHRWSWEFRNGPVPDGMVLDHLCRNRDCVNPDHLEVVTRGENLRRGNHRSAVMQRTNVCQRGHNVLETGFIVRHGYRECKVCENERKRKRREQRKARR